MGSITWPIFDTAACHAFDTWRSEVLCSRGTAPMTRQRSSGIAKTVAAAPVVLDAEAELAGPALAEPVAIIAFFGCSTSWKSVVYLWFLCECVSIFALLLEARAKTDVVAVAK